MPDQLSTPATLTAEQINAELAKCEAATPLDDKHMLMRYAHGGGRLLYVDQCGHRILIADFYDEANRECFYAARKGYQATLRALLAAQQQLAEAQGIAGENYDKWQKWRIKCGDAENALQQVHQQLAEAREENERLRTRLLTAAGDDLCRLSQEEIKAYTNGEVPIPPKEEFLPSCERFWEQTAAKAGVNHNCLTLAQLVAENEKAQQQLTAHAETIERLREGLEACEISMDTAALHGLPQRLPPADRDGWVEAHAKALDLLATLTTKGTT